MEREKNIEIFHNTHMSGDHEHCKGACVISK